MTNTLNNVQNILNNGNGTTVNDNGIFSEAIVWLVLSNISVF